MAQLYGFPANDARTLSGVAESERLRSQNRARLGYPFLLPEFVPAASIGKVSGTISAATVAASVVTPGSGTVTLYHRDHTSGDLVTLKDQDNNAITVTVYSFAGAASDSDIYIWAGMDMHGVWWWLNDPCTQPS